MYVSLAVSTAGSYSGLRIPPFWPMVTTDVPGGQKYVQVARVRSFCDLHLNYNTP